MTMPFSRTLRCLEAEKSRTRAVVLVSSSLLFAGWLAWLTLGKVTLYEVSDRARLEAAAAPHDIASEVEGQVREWRLEIGREVRAGEVLVRLDDEREQLALGEARARMDGVRKRSDALREELAAELAADASQRDTRRVVIEEAQARVVEAEEKARYRDEHLVKIASLHAQGYASEAEHLEAGSEAGAARAAVDALRLAVSRLEREGTDNIRERAVRMARIERQLADLSAEAGTEAERVRRLELEVKRRLVRSPIDGRIGRALDRRAGSVVKAAEVLGAVVPAGAARVVADFPVAAVGRIRAGQPARLRLDGYSWTRFGRPRARVIDIGSEPLDGRVRVELALIDSGATPGIRFEHGLSGVVEIEVERLSPAQLVLRRTGEWLSPASRPWTPGGELSTIALHER